MPPKWLLGTQKEKVRRVPGLRVSCICQDMREEDRDNYERQQFRGQWASDQGAAQGRD